MRVARPRRRAFYFRLTDSPLTGGLGRARMPPGVAEPVVAANRRRVRGRGLPGL